MKNGMNLAQMDDLRQDDLTGKGLPSESRPAVAATDLSDACGRL
jgi:hypothetical protein